LNSSRPKTTLHLTDLTPAEIAAGLCIEPYQGRQVFRWLHRKRVFDYDDMSDLPTGLRKRLAETCPDHYLVPLETYCSPRTGTKKVLFRLADGETIESVVLRNRGRTSLCLSTQVGCPLKCVFCATGQSGFVRNLAPGEIVEQALRMLADEDLGGRTPNIVYMGMGEPFLNYDAVVRSVRLLMAKEGLEIGARKLTISTVGDVPGIALFSDEKWQVRLTISLHAANDALRSRLVPLNRKYPLDALMAAVHNYVKKTRRNVTFEWVLIDGVNDSRRDAKELAQLLSGLRTSVNLIPYNTVRGADFAPPPVAECRAFRNELVRRGLRATLRHERGRDIDAACGQLRRREAKASG